MKVEYINPILESILDVFDTMVEIKITPGSVSLKKDALALGEVTGLVDMSGNNIQGSLAITFEKAVIFAVTQRLLDETHKEINLTVKDVVGEITNMVCGGSKARLSKRGYDIDMSVPEVLAHAGHDIDHRIKAPAIVLPFSCEHGKLFVEFCFKQMKKG